MKRFVKCCLIGLVLCFTSARTPAQTVSRESIRQEMAELRTKLRLLEDAYLQPAEEDKKLYATFLQQPGTGLIRLLPREVFDRSGSSLSGGGAYYSFARLTHEYGYGSDIELQRGNLSVGFAGANYGYLVKLGDIPLETISSKGGAALFLSTHQPPEEEPKARVEQRRASEGVTVGGFLYQNRFLARANTTYLVRSINYEFSDVLVAFRVVRLDNDDSLTVLWKLLEKYPTPRLERNR
jgi:hypothetical protein